MCSAKKQHTTQNTHTHKKEPNPITSSRSPQHWYVPPLFAASTASAGKPNWLISGPSCPEAKAALNMLNACEQESGASKPSLHHASPSPGVCVYCAITVRTAVPGCFHSLFWHVDHMAHLGAGSTLFRTNKHKKNNPTTYCTGARLGNASTLQAL